MTYLELIVTALILNWAMYNPRVHQFHSCLLNQMSAMWYIELLSNILSIVHTNFNMKLLTWYMYCSGRLFENRIPILINVLEGLLSKIYKR